MNEKLKLKFDQTKKKIKAHAPEILAFTTVAIGAVVAVRAIKKDLSNPIGYAVFANDEPVEDTITRTSISADEMKRRLDTQDISAFSVEGHHVTFYAIDDQD